MAHSTPRWIRQAAIVVFTATSLTGCASMINTMLGSNDSCQDTCSQTYQSCLEQVGTPDANHYCLSQKNQCVADC